VVDWGGGVFAGCCAMGVDPSVDRGTCPPYFLKWRECPVFCPPTFSGVDIFCTNAQLHGTDYIHRSFRLLVASTDF